MTDSALRDTLLKAARMAREHALALHTQVKVGAALRSADGKVITGCNIESPSNIEGMCAERVALVKALSEGITVFTHVAVIADFAVPIVPCGFCRQALFEFAADAVVIMANLTGEVREAVLADLLPMAYRIEDRNS